MVIRKSSVARVVISLLVIYPPVLLAAEYFHEGVGRVFQSFALILLMVSAIWYRVDISAPIGRAAWLLVAFCIFSAGVRASQSLADVFVDVQIVAKIVMITLAVLHAKLFYEKGYVDLESILTPALIGQTIMLVSQVMSSTSGVELEDRSYAGGMPGFSKSLAMSSAYLCALLPMVLFGFRPHRRRVQSIAQKFVLAFQILVTLRRTAWLSLALAFSYWSLRQNIKITVVVFLIIAMLYFTFDPTWLAGPIYDAAHSRFALTFADGLSGSGREEFYILALERIADFDVMQMLSGIGSVSLMQHMLRNFGMEIGSHSALLDFALIFGVPSVIALLWLYFRWFKAIYGGNHGDLKKATAVAVMVVVVFSTLSGVLFESALIPAFIVIGFGAAKMGLWKK